MLYFSDDLPSHQQSLAAVRGNSDFVKYILNVAVQKLTQVILFESQVTCSGGSEMVPFPYGRGTNSSQFGP